MIYSIAQALVHDNELAKPSPKRLPQARRKRAQKDLRLALNDQTLVFKSLDDFSFAIESRTCVPSSRFQELLRQEPAELWHEADNIKSVEKNLVDILEDALCDATICGPAIRDLGLQVFSKDHDWRLIVGALNELGDEYDGYKRLALIKYMQYLGARQEILRLIFAIKSKGETHHRAILDDDDDVAALETVLFDSSQLDDHEPAPRTLQRLPRGEAIKIYALPGHPVEVMLAKHLFKLINDDGWALCDIHGRRYPLGDRQNMIGRGSDNDVTLDSEFRNVSRRHLIAEPFDDHIVVLTDISSHGTFAPAMQTERVNS